ncbi:hypothetical protein BGLY_1118 [Bacillus glycinifermentans]|nr:hypothetical protein BGLY_1118 [Bacillus glycinifermentans]
MDEEGKADHLANEVFVKDRIFESQFEKNLKHVKA